MENTIHVIAHTHWDYEWYFTSNESFIQLCYHVDEVITALEEGILDYYMLDGQTSIVEDYLEANPDKQARFMELVENGKLKIGPWYTQSDQMIVRGESLVRNLQIGMELGNSFGGTDLLGYIPDAFGQSIDMPKICHQMGIHRAVFWRGLSSDNMKQREFFWESEDGSRVLAYNIKDGYFVGVQLIESDNCDAVMEQVKKDTVSSHFALPVGGDQRYVDMNLKERINHFNENLSEDQLVESNYDKLFEGIMEEKSDLPSVQGELLNAQVSKIHRSIYSTRYDHKYLNDKVERRLIYQVEPLMAIADHIGIPYKKDLLDKVWKLALRNHAHDSAGGCNSDKTNRSILQRLTEADELSYSLIDYLTRKISESRENIRPNQITVFNTLPIRQKKLLNLKVSLVNSDFAIYHKGEKIPYQFVNMTECSNDPIRRDVKPASESFYQEIEILVPVTLEPLGYDVLDIVEGEQGEIVSPEQNDMKESEPVSIENDYYKIMCEDGKVDVFDKVTGIWYRDFLFIEDSGDDGDNYDYSPPMHDNVLKLDFSNANARTEQGKIERSITLSGYFNVPLNLTERVEGQFNSQIPYECTISIRTDYQSINLQLDMENKAFDHRMRLVVNGDVKTDESIADSPFGTISRPVRDPNLENWREKGWKEEPSGIYPMLNFVNVHDSGKSITAFSKGMKEYEIMGSDGKGIALTLFRAVGYLGKPDLIRRPGVASGNQFRYIETPDSQMQQHMTFKCSLVVGRNFNAADAFDHYQHYAVSVPYYQHQSLNAFTNTLKYFVMQPLSETVPDAFSLLDASHSKNIVLSSVKMARDKTGLVVRFFNPADKDVYDSGETVCRQQIDYWHFINMAENEELSSRYKDQTIQLGGFKPKEIKTVYIRF